MIAHEAGQIRARAEIAQHFGALLAPVDIIPGQDNPVILRHLCQHLLQQQQAAMHIADHTKRLPGRGVRKGGTFSELPEHG